jgi:hypothetical protein
VYITEVIQHLLLKNQIVIVIVFISEIKYFKLEEELKNAAKIHSKDHLVIHFTRKPSYHLSPKIFTIVEVEDC